MTAVGNPTHRCKVCGAFWVKYPTHWSLFSKHAAPCCDNAAMGEQIEPVGELRDALMIEMAYARHVELPVSESTDRVISLLARGASA